MCFQFFPNNCFITTFKIKGKDLLKLIEKGVDNGRDEYLNVSGFYYFYDKDLPLYEKVKEIIMETDGEKFNINRVYRVATTESMFTKNEDLCKAALEKQITNYRIRDFLEEYFSTYIPIQEKYNNYDDKIKKIYKARDKKFVFKRNN